MLRAPQVAPNLSTACCAVTFSPLSSWPLLRIYQAVALVAASSDGGPARRATALLCGPGAAAAGFRLPAPAAAGFSNVGRPMGFSTPPW